jgi:Spy/CpxP family protein refolding chaperone
MNMTKRTFTALVALTGTLCFHLVARAADAPEAAKPAATVRERLQQLTTELKLTDAQREKVQTIVRERLEKLRELRQDASVSQAEKADKIKALREEIGAEIRKLLTPEQLEAWKTKQGRLLGTAQSPTEQLQESIKQLNLTDEQREKLKALYLEQMGKLRELREDAGLSLQAKLEKLQAMRKDITPEMKKVLDSAQFEKWEKGMDHWLENLKQRLPGQTQE